jgi:hypothetical protein
MRIEWNIQKKRGNLRPVLTYSVTLDPYEMDLCLAMVRIISKIPVPPEAYAAHCWPGSNERGTWTPHKFYPLSTPSHKTGTLEERLILPWREDNSYPEVEAGFETLRIKFEEMLEQASDSAPMDQHGALGTSTVARQRIAGAFFAERMLQAVNS